MLILVINPGSTSTKIAVYEDRRSLFVTTLRHSVEELLPFKTIVDQFDFRKSEILKALETNNIEFTELDAVIGRGGLIKPIPSGVYRVNQAMLEDCRVGYMGEHACNLGAIIAQSIADEVKAKSGKVIPTLIADPTVVDEMDDVARFSGHALIERKSVFHALNQKAIAKRYARENSLNYSDLNLIVVHLGGGVSVGVHKRGNVVDVNNALHGEGPFSPERAGGLPTWGVIDFCFSGKYSKNEVIKLLTGNGGVVSYTGSNSFMELEKAVKEGDTNAIAVEKAFCYQIAKEIGALATVVNGEVDAILITGGVAHNKGVIDEITERVKFIAPVKVYPGEDEMEALALNAYAAIKGEEEIKEY